MLSKEVKARRKYNRYRRAKSSRYGRRLAIQACDWIYRSWFMAQPLGPFRSTDERDSMIAHQSEYLVGFRRRLRKFVPRQIVWHHRNAAISNGMTPYELALEFKRFLTQDLKVSIGQSYVL